MKKELNMSKATVILFTAFAVFACAFAYGAFNDEAMALCQAKGFSFDTCFHSIHR